MRIPPAIDSAMWEVVESGDQALMDEFAARYPELKGELSKRLIMVRDLKGSKPKTGAKPEFTPRNDIIVPREAATWTSTTVFLAIAGAAILTFGSVRIYDVIQARQQPPAPTIQPTDTNPDQLKMYEPRVLPENAGDPAVTPSTTGASDPPKIDPAQLDPFLRPVTIAAENTSLSNVLQEIASKANIVLEAAPGMPDGPVSAQYVNVPALKVLEDLGRAFGFTAMKDGRRKALLVPVRDTRTPGGETGTGTTEAPPNSPTGESPLRGPVNSRDEGVLPPVGN